MAGLVIHSSRRRRQRPKRGSAYQASDRLVNPQVRKDSSPPKAPQSGAHTIIVGELLPDDLRAAFTKINNAGLVRASLTKVAHLTGPWVLGVAGSATRRPLSTVPVAEIGSVDCSGDGVRKASVWARLLGVERTVIEQIEFDDEEGLVICHVRPVKAERRRCGVCRRQCGRYDGALEHGLSNALIESTNTKIRLITRIALGFKDPTVLIALAMLSLGGYRPPLPGRPTFMTHR
jgi:Transposase